MENFLYIMASSSSGNCAFLKYRNTKILIDAGVSKTTIIDSLKTKNETLETIDAIFVTHEHTDHCRSLEFFLQNENIKTFANGITAEMIKYKLPRTKNLNWKIFNTGESFIFKDLKITPFSIPHDANDTVAYSIELENKKILWATDLGKPTNLVREMLKNANIIVLESNYCPDLLEKSSRPYQLKHRIKSIGGHLSNQDTFELLKDLNHETIEKIFLAHVSKECNSIENIQCVMKNLPQKILSKLEIVSPHTAGNLHSFLE